MLPPELAASPRDAFQRFMASSSASVVHHVSFCFCEIAPRVAVMAGQRRTKLCVLVNGLLLSDLVTAIIEIPLAHVLLAMCRWIDDRIARRWVELQQARWIYVPLSLGGLELVVVVGGHCVDYMCGGVMDRGRLEMLDIRRWS